MPPASRHCRFGCVHRTPSSSSPLREGEKERDRLQSIYTYSPLLTSLHNENTHRKRSYRVRKCITHTYDTVLTHTVRTILTSSSLTHIFSLKIQQQKVKGKAARESRSRWNRERTKRERKREKERERRLYTSIHRERVRRNMHSAITKVFLAMLVCCMVNSAVADVLGIASTLQCALSSSNGSFSNSNAIPANEGGDVSSSTATTTVVSMEGGDAGDARKEMLTSLVDYGCYCNVGMLGGTFSEWGKKRRSWIINNNSSVSYMQTQIYTAMVLS